MKILRKFIQNVLKEEVTAKTTWSRMNIDAFKYPEERFKIMMGSNVSMEAAKKVNDLLDQYGISSKGPAKEILTHVDNNDEVGIAIRRHAKMETDTYLKWKNLRDQRKAEFEKEIENFRKKWETFSPERQKIELYYEDNSDTLEDIIEKKRHEHSLEEREIYVYRKSSHDDGERRILSYTLSEDGANIGSGRRLKPDKKTKIDDLLNQGWMILGGIVRMMGSSGESEVTFIKF